MNIVHSDEQQVQQGVQSIFLAGPTPRNTSIASWRPEAVSILERLGFQGSVLIPERRDWSTLKDYDEQFLWELDGLNRCTVICFWIPRVLPDMPAFTTNVEFGHFVGRKPIVYGRPPDICQNRYLDRLYQYYNLQDGPYNELSITLAAAYTKCMTLGSL